MGHRKDTEKRSLIKRRGFLTAVAASVAGGVGLTRAAVGRQPSSAVSLLEFVDGGAGTELVPFRSASNTGGLLEAVNAIGKSGIIEVPYAHYEMTSGFSLSDGSHLTIRGDGVFRVPATRSITAHPPFFYLTNCRRVVIEGIRLVDEDAAMHLGVHEETHGIVLTDCEDCVVRGVTVQGVGDEGVNIVWGMGNVVDRCMFDDNVLLSVARAGAVTLTNTRRAVVTGCTFNQSRMQAIRLECNSNPDPALGIFGVNITGNTFHTVDCAIELGAANGGRIRGVNIKDNIFNADELQEMLRTVDFNGGQIEDVNLRDNLIA